MQNRFGLLDTDVMPIFMIIALDIVITLRFSIKCLVVICSPTVLFTILREASSETYGPRVYFPSYMFLFSILLNLVYILLVSYLLFHNLYFPIYTSKIPKIFTLLSLSNLTFEEGINNPFIALGASSLIICAGIQ